MKIAIIGSGVSGLTAGHLLHRDHDITLFEANDYVGGHVNTVEVCWQGDHQVIDTGFIVHNDRTYPNFCALMDELGIETLPTSMSFSVANKQTGFEYNGTSINGLFAQRGNLVRPRFHRMIRDILRFNREALQLAGDDSQTVQEFLTENRYSREFQDHYLLPMGAAIWSCPPDTFSRFPIRFIVEFYSHHGLLSLKNRPVWKVIQGGSHEYVKKLIAPFQNQIRLSTPVLQVKRNEHDVEIIFTDKNHSTNSSEKFDEVIFACHSDQALKMLEAPSIQEQQLLGAFPYSRNEAVLHVDESVLPRRKRAWASWNYGLVENENQLATVTYNMNILQHLKSDHVYCVTLNDTEAINPAKVIKKIIYYHPIFTVERESVQKQHHNLIRNNQTSFCGAYWGNGFHEDGVSSAIRVCEQFQTEQGTQLESQPVQYSGSFSS